MYRVQKVIQYAFELFVCLFGCRSKERMILSSLTRLAISFKHMGHFQVSTFPMG